MCLVYIGYVVGICGYVFGKYKEYVVGYVFGVYRVCGGDMWVCVW